ncbi:ribosome-interacting gtpase 1 [Acrodontium crateriforme]|uniref:Ribosome-interacting gtpase 1 n=1 Tax=Acrodontium crateriforme TaxID=150365 RepID=A0AAQ3M058_9PEZI|nr:ribosome-interacting gtpase 1 [Acrodontium crateriforme]
MNQDSWMTAKVGLRLATVATITSSAFLAGKTSAQSFSAPALLLSPTPLLAEQWTTHLGRDRSTVPLNLVASSGFLAFLAQRALRSTNNRWLYAMSSATLLIWVPYSIFFLGPINRKLAGKAAQLRKQYRKRLESQNSSPVVASKVARLEEASSKKNQRSAFDILLSLWTLDLWSLFSDDDETALKVDQNPTPEIAAQDFESVHLLVDQWATLNLGRTLMASLAAGMATWAAIGEM